MSVTVLISIAVNATLFVAIAILWRRVMGPKKDDPRLSKGLQILQSKIAILEDLSDRTDVQVKQLTALLEQKSLELQERMFEADQQIQTVRHSMDQSLEVARIFEDRIPHQEIIERQNTKKYILAAQLAHEGKPQEEISRAVDLPKGELDLIVKMNREHLMFSEADLPAWAKEISSTEAQPVDDRKVDPTMAQIPSTGMSSIWSTTPNISNGETPRPSHRPKTLESLGSAFRKAVPEIRTDPSGMETRFAESKIFQRAARVLEEEARDSVPNNRSNSAPDVKPAEFKKINLNDALG